MKSFVGSCRRRRASFAAFVAALALGLGSWVEAAPACRDLFASPHDSVRAPWEIKPEARETWRRKLVTAFVQAAAQKGRERDRRTRPRRPSAVQMLHHLAVGWEAIREDVLSGRFDTTSLESVMEQTVGGWDQLEAMALTEQGAGSLRHYTPSWANLDRMLELRARIEGASGFIVSSVTAGVPLNQSQWIAMKAYARDRGWPLVIIPTTQILSPLPEDLLQDPNVFVLTHTIRNDFFNLSNIPLTAKLLNPAAGLLGRRQVRPGQIRIVGHPQISMLTAPTGINHIRDTEVWSTGSVSLPLYPYAMPIQGRTADMARNNHVQGFLVVEKADPASGLTGLGTHNQYHVRAVEWIDDAPNPWMGFTDLGQSYRVARGSLQVERSFQSPTVMVRGDLHERVADPRFTAAHRELLLMFPDLNLVVDHDGVDGISFNHHLFEDLATLARQQEQGINSILREFERWVAAKNALLAIRPELRTVDVSSNHPRWLQNLLRTGRVPAHIEVTNKRFLDELRYAHSVMGVSDPLAWVLNHRNAWLDSLPEAVRRNHDGTTRIMDPRRARVLGVGEGFVVGPSHRETHLENHGDRGANGARGSARAHSTGNWSSITGDSHVSAILGGWMSVGTSTPKRLDYSMGGYSAWSNSVAVIYPDGSKQLLVYRSAAATMFRRPGVEVSQGLDFFGDSRLEVVPNDNDHDGIETAIYDQHSEWLRRWHRTLGGD